MNKKADHTLVIYNGYLAEVTGTIVRYLGSPISEDIPPEGIYKLQITSKDIYETLDRLYGDISILNTYYQNVVKPQDEKQHV